jgi:hypothetical protein
LLLQVPWSNLGQQPVVAELDRLFLVAGPKEDDSTKQQDGSKQGASPSAASNPEQLERSAKSQRVAAAEAAWLKVRQQGAKGNITVSNNMTTIVAVWYGRILYVFSTVKGRPCHQKQQMWHATPSTAVAA